MHLKCATILLLVVSSYCQEEYSMLDQFIGPYRRIRSHVLRMIENTYTEDHMNNLRNNKKLQAVYADNIPFPCSTNGTRSPERPTSVHKLQPGDIDVVGGIGDSVSAGFGLFATNSIQLVLESRGAAFSMGGDETWRTYLTIPNILKEFNPNIMGYSRGNSITIDKRSHFNVAEGGAVSKNMPYMSKILVQRMRNDPAVNLKKDWKMITIFFGMNDICSEICYRHNPEIVLEEHKQHMLDVLRTLRDNLPRTLVLLIPPMSTTLMRKINKKPILCDITHGFECSCVFGQAYQYMYHKLEEIVVSWQELDVEISKYSEFDRDDFTVVAQPFTINMTVPYDANDDFDLNYMSADCFHLSQMGNAVVANNLWNTLLMPTGQKRNPMDYKLLNHFRCPNDKHPYIFTNKNSIE